MSTKSVAFYNEIGFRVTEYTEDEETGRLWAAWTHRKGGVHDIAFTNGRGPRLHHVAFWVPTPLNIIDLLDLMATTGWLANIERGPGRHGISNAFFLYIRDPDGHRIEIYCSDYQTVDPDLEPIKWDLKDPQRQTLWGAPAPKSWFEEGSVFAGVRAVRESDLKASADRGAVTMAELQGGTHERVTARLSPSPSAAGPGYGAIAEQRRRRPLGPPRRALADIARSHRGRRLAAPGRRAPRAFAAGFPARRHRATKSRSRRRKRSSASASIFPTATRSTRTGRPRPRTRRCSSASRAPSSAMAQPLMRPPESPQLDYEGEIVIVIGKAGRRIAEADALDHIAALSLCNEGTIRDWVRHAKFNVTQGKNFDRTGAIGPWLVPFTDESADRRHRAATTRVNGEVRQRTAPAA